MFYFAFQLFLLFLFVLALGAWIKNNILRFLLIFLGGFFFILQLVSLAFNGKLINYRFCEQINFGNIGSVVGFFSAYIVWFILLFIGFLVMMHFITKIIQKRQPRPVFLIGVLLVTGICFFLPHGIGANLYEVVNIKTARTRSFHNALKKLGIQPETYISHGEIDAKAGKNIIVLSLESLERGYLDPPLAELTPHLNTLAEKHTYIDIQQQFGASWTSASIYTVLTGTPAYFKDSRGSNSIFQNTSAIRIGGLASVLQAAGYDMNYFIAKKDFSGIDDMLKSLGFKVFSGGDFQKSYKRTHWGIQDKDLFHEFKKRLGQAGRRPSLCVFSLYRFRALSTWGLR